MREFDVKIKEFFEMTVTVEAGSAAQARKIAERNWDKGDYLIDADYFEGVTFTVPTRNERER